MNKKNIHELFEDEELIEIKVIEMHNKEFLVYLETTEKKTSVLTDNWEDLINQF
jgi:hypothetical protein